MWVSKKVFFFEAEAMMAIDKEAGVEYENTVVAYILRHQAATELIATDASGCNFCADGSQNRRS